MKNYPIQIYHKGARCSSCTMSRALWNNLKAVFQMRLSITCKKWLSKRHWMPSRWPKWSCLQIMPKNERERYPTLRNDAIEDYTKSGVYYHESREGTEPISPNSVMPGSHEGQNVGRCTSDEKDVFWWRWVPMSNVWSHEKTHTRFIDEPSANIWRSITDASPDIRRCIGEYSGIN